MADLSSLLGAAGIGGAIGKAIVSLELDTKKYHAELQTAQAQTVASRAVTSCAVAISAPAPTRTFPTTRIRRVASRCLPRR